jgi:hypothetical protein
MTISNDENPKSEEKRQSDRPRLKNGNLLPFRKEHKTKIDRITSGAHSMRRAYFCNGINRSTRQGIIIKQLEQRIARHRGYQSMEEMPITQQLRAQLLIGNLIFLSLYEPAPDSKQGYRDFHTAQNLCDRILGAFGMEPVEKPEKTLAQYIEEREQQPTEKKGENE